MHSAIVANSNHEMHVATVAFVSAVAVVVIADDVVMAVKVAACWARNCYLCCLTNGCCCCCCYSCTFNSWFVIGDCCDLSLTHSSSNLVLLFPQDLRSKLEARPEKCDRSRTWTASLPSTHNGSRFWNSPLACCPRSRKWTGCLPSTHIGMRRSALEIVPNWSIDFMVPVQFYSFATWFWK